MSEGEALVITVEKSYWKISFSGNNNLGFLIYCLAGCSQIYRDLKSLVQALWTSLVVGLNGWCFLWMSHVNLECDSYFWCSIIHWIVQYPQQAFQRCFNVVIRLIWRCDVRQRQINVETKLYLSTLKLSTLSNVESTLSISTLILTTLDNVETMLLFSTSSFTTLINVKTTLWIWPVAKRWKEQKCIFWKKRRKKLNTPTSKFRLLFQNLVDFTPRFRRNMEKNICKAAKVLMTKMLHYKNHI